MAVEEDDLALEPADAGTAFRAEMWATNTLLGYWKHLVAVLVMVLMGFLIYSKYADFVQRDQRTATAEIAGVEAELPAGILELPNMLSAGTITPEEVTKAADALSAVAAKAKGPARVEARLKAAELYRMVDAPERQRAELEDAAQNATEVLAYAAQGALANLDLAEGRGEEAVKRLRTLTDSSQGFLSEQALLDLGLALESLDRQAEAQALYADFLVKHPDSPRADQVRARQNAG